MLKKRKKEAKYYDKLFWKNNLNDIASNDWNTQRHILNIITNSI